MKAAVITFPGSNCDRDLAVALEQAGADVVRVWHKDDALPEGVDLVGRKGRLAAVVLPDHRVQALLPAGPAILA